MTDQTTVAADPTALHGTLLGLLGQNAPGSPA